MAANWTPAVLNKVKALLAKGHSTAEIGKKIGFSKNAVVGKLNRLGWNAKSMEEPTKKSPAKSAIKPARQSAGKTIGKKPAESKSTPVKTSAKKPTIAKKSTAAAKTTPLKAQPKVPASKMQKGGKSSNLAMHKQIVQHSLAMVALKPDQCRWPIGDPDTENFHFCGEKVFVGKPYCYEHCRAAYQFQAPKKKHGA